MEEEINSFVVFHFKALFSKNFNTLCTTEETI